MIACIYISEIGTIANIVDIIAIVRINFLELFEEINGVEDLLRQDPADVYDKMDYKTKEFYRNKIKKLSQKTKMSEIYIAKKILELAQKSKQIRKRHIGYYLIDKGENLLNNELGIKSKKRSKKPIYFRHFCFL